MTLLEIYRDLGKILNEGPNPSTGPNLTKYNKDIPSKGSEQEIKSARKDFLTKLKSFSTGNIAPSQDMYTPWFQAPTQPNQNPKIIWKKYGNRMGSVSHVAIAMNKLPEIIQHLENVLSKDESKSSEYSDAEVEANQQQLEQEAMAAVGVAYSSKIVADFLAKAPRSYDSIEGSKEYEELLEDADRVGRGLAGEGASFLGKLVRNIGAQGNDVLSRDAVKEYLSCQKSLFKAYEFVKHGGSPLTQEDIDNVRKFQIKSRKLHFGGNDSSLLGAEALRFDSQKDRGAFIAPETVESNGVKRRNRLFDIAEEVSKNKGTDGNPLLPTSRTSKGGMSAFIGAFGDKGIEQSVVLASMRLNELDESGAWVMSDKSKKVMKDIAMVISDKLAGASEFIKMQDSQDIPGVHPIALQDIEDLIESVKTDLGIKSPADKDVVLYCMAVALQQGANHASIFGGSTKQDNRGSGVSQDGIISRHDTVTKTKQSIIDAFFNEIRKKAGKEYGDDLTAACMKHLVNKPDGELKVSWKFLFGAGDEIGSGKVSVARLYNFGDTVENGIAIAENDFAERHIAVGKELGGEYAEKVTANVTAGREILEDIKSSLETINTLLDTPGELAAVKTFLRNKQMSASRTDTRLHSAYEKMSDILDQMGSSPDKTSKLNKKREFIAEYVGNIETSHIRNKTKGLGYLVALKHHLSSGSSDQMLIAKGTSNGKTTYTSQSAAYGPLYQKLITGDESIAIKATGKPGDTSRTIAVEHKGKRAWSTSTRLKSRAAGSPYTVVAETSNKISFLDNHSVVSDKGVLQEIKLLAIKKEIIGLLEKILPGAANDFVL